MKVLLAVLLLGAFTVAGQQSLQIGDLRCTACNDTSSYSGTDSLHGLVFPATLYQLTASSRVQLSCNFGDPSRNRYEEAPSSITISYAPDPSGTIYASMMAEIREYVAERESYSAQYNFGNDFSNLQLLKSFRVDETGNITAVIHTDHEREGAYLRYYYRNALYTITLGEGTGLGRLSSFYSEHLHFMRNNTPVTLGRFVTQLDELKELANSERHE